MSVLNELSEYPGVRSSFRRTALRIYSCARDLRVILQVWFETVITISSNSNPTYCFKVRQVIRLLIDVSWRHPIVVLFVGDGRSLAESSLVPPDRFLTLSRNDFK